MNNAEVSRIDDGETVQLTASALPLEQATVEPPIGRGSKHATPLLCTNGSTAWLPGPAYRSRA